MNLRAPLAPCSVLVISIALAACGPQPLEETLDPVPEGRMEFVLDDGVYDVEYTTTSNDCSDFEAHALYSTQVTVGTNEDGTGAFNLELPSSFFGRDDRVPFALGDFSVHSNPSVITSRSEFPLPIEVIQTIRVERAGPDVVELEITSRFDEECDHVASVLLTRQE